MKTIKSTATLILSVTQFLCTGRFAISNNVL